LIPGLESNLLYQLFRESIIREIEWKRTLMFPMAIVRRCSLFRVHIFADTKRAWAIENSPSHLIADYFQLSKSRLALMDGSLSFIDQHG
jgi:hypothetical protein